MSAFVVDASVAVKWFLSEPYTPQARSLLVSDDALHAPELLPLEVDSVLCRRMRRGEFGPGKAAEFRAIFRESPLELHPILDVLDEGFALASMSRCTPYDCLYVALAQRLGGRMVTADERLCHNLAASPFADYLLWIGDVK